MIWYRLFRLRGWFRKVMYKLGWVPKSELVYLLDMLKDMKEK